MNFSYITHAYRGPIHFRMYLNERNKKRVRKKQFQMVKDDITF